MVMDSEFAYRLSHGTIMAPSACAAARLGFLTLVLAGLAGCRLGTDKVTQNSDGYDAQVSALLKVAPVGTERSEAVRRLEQAGVEGAFGISQSIYYCNCWRRESGERLRLDVALLFDQEGRLYATRQGDTEVTIEKGSGTHASNRPTTAAAAGSNSAAAASTPSSVTPAPPRSGPRSPF
jgi:hypothetical protein